jgi:hypothetical protein
MEPFPLCSRQIMQSGSIFKELLRIKLRFDLCLTMAPFVQFLKVGLT